MNFENCIIYIIGHPGVGKLTTARAICAASNFRLIDAHKINNLLFPFVRIDGTTKIPRKIWDSALAIRNVVIDAMVGTGNRSFSYVFTNCLYEDSEIDKGLYSQLENAANEMGAVFLPVHLYCSLDENKNRVQNPLRNNDMKMTDASALEDIHKGKILSTRHKNEFVLDNTNLSADDSAQKILSFLSSVIEK